MKVKTMVRKLIMCLILFLFSTPAFSLPVFYQWGGEKIIKIIDLPDSPAFQKTDGKYIDIGYRYQQLNIFFIPIWNYNEKWCGYIGSDKEYLDLDKKYLSELAETAGLKLPDSPSLPIWDYIGGKLLFGLVFALSYGKKIFGNSEKKEASVELQSVRKGSVKKSV